MEQQSRHQERQEQVFLGRLSPAQSSDLAKQGQAKDCPGSVGRGWREATCCAADAAEAKKGA